MKDGRVVRFKGPNARGGLDGGADLPLGRGVAAFLDPLPGNAPYELVDVFQRAIDSGVPVSAIQIGRTRDITTPLDLVSENFPYLA